MLLQDRIAIVTGAGRGIGKAISRGLAQEGATVLVTDLVEVSAESVAGGLRDEGLRAEALTTDVSDEASVNAMARHALHKWGKIDILVNNAGYLQVSLIVDMQLEEWEKVFAVDARGVFLCSRAVLPAMIERRYGRIVTVSSIASYMARPKEAHYCAAKAAAAHFTRCLAFEVARYGITANVLCPGITRTRMVEDDLATDPGAQARWLASVPLGDFAQVEDHADAVVFLASEHGKHITGQPLSVDGGQGIAWMHGFEY